MLVAFLFRTPRHSEPGWRVGYVTRRAPTCRSSNLPLIMASAVALGKGLPVFFHALKSELKTFDVVIRRTAILEETERVKALSEEAA